MLQRGSTRLEADTGLSLHRHILLTQSSPATATLRGLSPAHAPFSDSNPQGVVPSSHICSVEPQALLFSHQCVEDTDSDREDGGEGERKKEEGS